MDRNVIQAFDIYGSQCPEDALQSLQMIQKSFLPVGYIRVYWHSRDSSTATAFAIDKHTIVTCGHNVYSCRQRRLCDKIEFFLPGNECIDGYSGPYLCTNPKQIMFRVPTGPMDHSPTPEELAIFTLNPGQVLTCKEYIKIGHLPQFLGGKKLKLVGYPDAEDLTRSQRHHKDPIRTELQGELLSIQDHILYHTMSTRTGHSGSPILVQVKQGVYLAIGIHTHRGSGGINSGLYFSPKIRKMGDRYFKRLQKQLIQQYPIAPRYPDPEFFEKRDEDYRISEEEAQKMYQDSNQQAYEIQSLAIHIPQRKFLDGQSLDRPEYSLKMMDSQQEAEEDDDESDSQLQTEDHSNITANSGLKEHSLQLQTQYCDFDPNPVLETQHSQYHHTSSMADPEEEQDNIRARIQIQLPNIEEAYLEPETGPGPR